MTPRCDPYGLDPLWQCARAGDAGAWNTLLGRLRPYLRALVHSWIGKDLALLDDSGIVQEALTRLHQHREQCRADGVPQLLGWARTIVRRLCAETFRASRSAKPLPDDLHDPEPGPDERAVQQEAGFRLAAAIDQLPDNRRTVVLLRLIEGLSFKDIAARTGTTEDTLRVLFHRSVKQLREILRGELE